MLIILNQLHIILRLITLDTKYEKGKQTTAFLLSESSALLI